MELLLQDIKQTYRSTEGGTKLLPGLVITSAINPQLSGFYSQSNILNPLYV